MKTLEKILYDYHYEYFKAFHYKKAVDRIEFLIEDVIISGDENKPIVLHDYKWEQGFKSPWGHHANLFGMCLWITMWITIKNLLNYIKFGNINEKGF